MGRFFLQKPATIGLFVSLVVAASFGFYFWFQRGIPKRAALQVLKELNQAVAAGDFTSERQFIQIPHSISKALPATQSQWLYETLKDEISAPGLAELRRKARFGPLIEIFPQEAKHWAALAGVPAEKCLAFRMERDGIRAEVVLGDTPQGFQVLRCNNVKQMAPSKVN